MSLKPRKLIKVPLSTRPATVRINDSFQLPSNVGSQFEEKKDLKNKASYPRPFNDKKYLT